MNDNPSPFEIHPDEHLEARITAYVLGEASPFEAAEIESLIAKSPELKLFANRTRTLNELLKEAETTANTPHPDWKLTGKKRAALNPAIGPIHILTPLKEKSIRRASYRAAFGIAAVFVVTFFTLRLIPSGYEAEAVIEIKPQVRNINPFGGEAASTPAMTPQFFGTEFEKIKSRRSLEQVVDNLDLTTRWKTDKETAIQKLRKSVETENIRGTDLISIRVRDAKEEDAKQITREITIGYRDYRNELAQKSAEQGIKELKKAFREQEDKIEERRKILTTISRTKDINYRGDVDDALAARQLESKKEALERNIDTQDYVDAKRDFETEKKLLEQMKLKLITEEISERIPGDSIVIHDMPPESTEMAASKPSIFTKAKAILAEPAARQTAAPAMVAAEAAPQIHIGGQVGQTGSVAFKEGMTLGEAVTGAGGTTEFGSKKRIKIYRGGKAQTYDITDPKLAQLKLHANDTIEVPQKNWFGRGASRDELVQNDLQRKPASPSSSTAKAIAANTPSTSAIPVPDMAPAEPSSNFGDGQDFGGGWGSVDGGRMAGEKDESLAMSGRDSGRARADDQTLNGIVTGGLRSGDQAVSRNNIDSILNNPGRTAEGAKETSESDAFNNSPAQPTAEPMSSDAGAADPFAAMEDAQLLGNTGIHDQERDMLEKSAAADGNEETKGALGNLGNPIRTNPALTSADREAKSKEWGFDLQAEAGKKQAGSFRANNASANMLEKMNFSADSRFDMGSHQTADPFFDTSGILSDTAKSTGGVEYEINTGYKSEYLFRGRDLTAKQKEIEKPINLADLSNEIPAAQEPFSTFSLNISDASFQVASSAVAKGERPDPESIKPEQFYNAVSYDDPAPSTGEPVAAAIAQVAHPVIPGRNLVRMSVRTASTGRAATQPLVLTLLVDQSGSMARGDRRAAMDTALTQLATLMQPDDRITVIGFSRTPRLLADSLPGDQAEKLPDIINQSSSEGGTNLEEALNLAENLALRHKVDGAQNRIVLFTDGAANLGNADPERLAERVKSLRQQDLAFDIAGIGTNDINDRLLSELSRHGNGRYYLVGENTAGNLAKQLAGAFRPAAENVKIQVKFNPQRVGNYKLIGFKKDRLKTEDFRNDAVDAAELAADESGTALYQVEPLPDGSGEIGELYVRFRDTATGEMVERSWTIPYESQTPAIDRAAPQMQLAALSLLAAQKLQTGPLADAINFRDLAPTIAAVKQAYGHSPQAQQMITLINALK